MTFTQATEDLLAKAAADRDLVTNAVSNAAESKRAACEAVAKELSPPNSGAA